MLLPLLSFAALAQTPTWPRLDGDISRGTGGAHDAALIIGVEDYAFIPDVPGARANADDWYLWLTRGRGVPAAHVTLLRDAEATAEKMRRFAGETADQVERGGTVWLVFVGHGAPDGGGGMLVGSDAQADADSLFARSVPQEELIKALSAGDEGQVVAVVDSCFSGRSPTGAPLVEGVQFVIPAHATAAPERTAILTAGRADQFAGPLPGAQRPAFSYLVLGAMRGWGDADGDGVVTAGEATSYASDALDMLLVDRTQDPQLQGLSGVPLGGGKERGPDLTAMVLARPASTASAYGEGIRVSVPETTFDFSGSGGIGAVDVEGERLLDAALALEEDSWASPVQKRDAWCKLSRHTSEPPLGPGASDACQAWGGYIDQLAAIEAQMSVDYTALAGLVSLPRRSADEKIGAIDRFVTAYAALPDDRRVRAAVRARAKLEDGKEATLPEGIAHAAVAPGQPDPNRWARYPESRGGLKGLGAGVSYGMSGANRPWVGGTAFYDHGWLESTGRVGVLGNHVVLDLEPGLILSSWPDAAFPTAASILNPVVGPSFRMLLADSYDSYSTTPDGDAEEPGGVGFLSRFSAGVFAGNTTWLQDGMAVRVGLTLPLTGMIFRESLPFSEESEEETDGWSALLSMDILWAGRWR
ncbi:MAG: caspase family protein [Deltaproteobacteria bacterium]|nr:caspase family protein [Deltaproteobacteria bacterium]